ncbi:DUF4199 domain-containing protein [Wenyingzhuangia aestuarii]|uniref:DUF4199 domain-containing protein n=1 Tax=Wenyingzhuangia aestuarii TaxID=1647582 RepID=UPI00143A2D85|nr:DUF4199 domain-containing protein [Wenyingzhuangia aestuarii]NJB83977.1 uncharacterized membrane protein (DUF485 family) [Wenyingzhuangia aestuarii]
MNSFFSTKPVLKFGAISGLLLVLNELILYYSTNTNPYIGERTSELSIIGLVIPVIMVVIAITFLKKNTNIESFGQIIKPGLIIGFLTALIYIAYTLLFVFSIEPDTLNQFDEINRQRLIASGNITDAKDIADAVQLTRNAFIPGTVLFSIAINLFIGFLTAVITAIFVRNK